MRPNPRFALPFALLTIVVLAGCLAPMGTSGDGSTTDDALEQPDRTDSTPPKSGAESPAEEAPGNGQSSGIADDGSTPGQGTEDGSTEVPDSRSGPGLAEPISVNTTLNRSGLRYYPDNDTIRYVAAYRHSNHEAVANGSATPEREPVYESVPVEEWLAVEAPYAGADAVRERITARLDGTHSLSTGVSSTDNGSRIMVATRTLLSREGEVLSTPNVTFDRLRSVTPANVTVTITVDEHSQTRTYPVEVRRMVLRQE